MCDSVPAEITGARLRAVDQLLLGAVFPWPSLRIARLCLSTHRIGIIGCLPRTPVHRDSCPEPVRAPTSAVQAMARSAAIAPRHRGKSDFSPARNLLWLRCDPSCKIQDMPDQTAIGDSRAACGFRSPVARRAVRRKRGAPCRAAPGRSAPSARRSRDTRVQCRQDDTRSFAPSQKAREKWKSRKPKDGGGHPRFLHLAGSNGAWPDARSSHPSCR